MKKKDLTQPQYTALRIIADKRFLVSQDHFQAHADVKEKITGKFIARIHGVVFKNLLLKAYCYYYNSRYHIRITGQGRRALKLIEKGLPF